MTQTDRQSATNVAVQQQQVHCPHCERAVGAAPLPAATRCPHCGRLVQEVGYAGDADTIAGAVRRLLREATVPALALAAGLAGLLVMAILALATLAGADLLRDVEVRGYSLTVFELIASLALLTMAGVTAWRFVRPWRSSITWYAGTVLTGLGVLVAHGFWLTATYGGPPWSWTLLIGVVLGVSLLLWLFHSERLAWLYGEGSVREARSFTRKALLHTTLVVVSIVMIAPLVWMIAAAFKPPEIFFEYTFFPPPGELAALAEDDRLLYNFRELFGEMPYFRLMMNSFFVTGGTVMVQLFFASLGGFALAKYEFRGKKPIMILMLMTMMIPPHVMMAPLYELITHMHLIDTHVGLIVPGMVSVFGMFLFRQSMLSIPKELLEAGRMDGCSEFRLYWNIAVPVSRPMVGAFCLFSFMATWNSFLWPQILLKTSERFTLPIGLNQLVGLQQQNYGALMAGTLLSILPVVVLFFVLQKEFISGLTAGAVKG